MLQLDAGIGGGAAPLDGLGLRIVVPAPGRDLGGHLGLFGEASVEALADQATQLALGHVEPVAVGRGVVPLQPGRQAVFRSKAL